MTTLLSILNQPLASQVGWAVLHSLWQGALIGLAFGLARLVLRRRSANARYLAGCLSLGLLLAGPVATVLVQTGPPRLTGHPTPTAIGLHVPVSVGSAVTPYSTGSFTAWRPDFLERLAPVLAAIWIAGVGLSAARLAQGSLRVRRIRGGSNEPADPEWVETFNDLRCRLRVTRPVKLLKSALVEVPTVVGWLRPVILLPLASLGGLTPTQLEAILAHELAHVRRLDYLVNTFQCLVETLMFYHPIAWWISGCIREERENCCDDLVVQVCGDRLAYARALAVLEGFRAGLPGWALAATGGSLLNRIRRLLGDSCEQGSTTVRHVSGLALVCVGLLVIALGVRLALSPATYLSTALIRCERTTASAPGQAGDHGVEAYDPYFIQTEFEVLQSELILAPVVEKLSLTRKWASKYGDGSPLKTVQAITILRHRLELRPVRNTSLAEIRVYDESPQEAAAIANGIAETWRTHREGQLAQIRDTSLKALEDRFHEQEAKVADARARVDELRKALNIQDSALAGDGVAPLMSADTLRKLETMRLENRAEYVRQSTLLEHLARLKKESSPDDFAQAVSTSVPDALLNSLLEQKSLADQKLVSASKEFGPQHTEVVTARAVADDLHQKIATRADAILVALKAKTASLQSSLEDLQKETDQAKARDIQNADRARPYFEAKRNLDELQRFSQILDMKIASERVDLQLPQTPAAEIVERAWPAARPVAPNMPLALALIFLGVLLDIAGLLVLTGFGLTRLNRGLLPKTA